MKTTSAFIAAALAITLPLGAAQAQTSSGAGKKTIAAPVSTKKRAPARVTAAKTAKKSQAALTPTPVPAPVQPQDASSTTPETAAAYQHIQTGTIPCELGTSVAVNADDGHPGFYNVTAGKQRYYMHPVESRTGVIRLEDDRAGAVWLQLGNKSMLMDQKQGRRVADDCVSPQQRAVAAQLQSRPQPSLLDGPKNKN
jgi:hypothetical protein